MAAERDRERLDRALVSRGHTASRSRAAAAIADGRVRVDGRIATRASEPVRPDQLLSLDDDGRVGRAAHKLERAFDAFPIDVAGRLALDVGASTGGFTQVLLDHGAHRVVALDVGHGQLVESLRSDPRVVVVEGVNARDLDRVAFAELAGVAAAPALVVIDVSFISLRLVLPAVASLLEPGGTVVALVKPQFEVGRTAAGVVRDQRTRAAAVRGVLDVAAGCGLRTDGVTASPITGEHGNVEVLVHLTAAARAHPTEWDPRIWQQQIDDASQGSAG